MQLSDPELAKIRFHPQQTEQYLSVFRPTTAMAALVNSGAGPVARGSYVIPYNTVSSGSYLAIEAGMTMLVGTTPGGRELGKIRVRSATNTNITVSENSSINWPAAVYLTVLRYFELWPVYPRIISNPSNPEDVIFFKDYDISYTNQNDILGAFPCAGSHLAGWAGDNFYFTNTGTSHVLGSALTHDWAFEGATVTGSTSATPGNITWNTPGHYVVRYRVTAANGSVDITYRYVSIYNRPSASSQNNPIAKWEIDTVSGSRDEAGYNTQIRVVEENLSINEGDVVVIFEENWYGAEKISLGSNTSNPDIFFVGHVLSNSISFDYQSKTSSFEVASITSLMRSMEGFSISVESKRNPNTWFELKNMNGKSAIYHYLRWHTTLLNLSDFQFFGTDQNTQYFDSDRGSILDAIDNYMRSALEGKVVADLQGRVYAEVGAWVTSNPTGSYPTIMSITRRDWLGEPSIVERLSPPISFLERGGVAYSGPVTGTFSALISSAPGSVPAFRGGEDKNQGMTLASQTQLNELTGNLLANKNSQFPEISMRMAGNYRNFDIAPQNTVAMDILSTDNNRQIEIHAPYIIDKISWIYDVKNKVRIPEVSFISLINGPTGETVTIPPVEDISFGGGFNVPGIRMPHINPLVPGLTTGIRFWGGRFDDSSLSVNPSVITASGKFIGLMPLADSTLVSLGTNGPIIVNSGWYLIVAVPKASTSNGSDATLSFFEPVSWNSTDSLLFKDMSPSTVGDITFVRPVYYTAGQTVAFTIFFAAPGGFVALDLYIVKLF